MAKTKRKAAARRRKEQPQTLDAREIVLERMFRIILNIMDLPEPHRTAQAELILAMMATRGAMPPELAGRLKAVCRRGSDPDWQLEEIKEITAGLNRRH